MQWPWPAVEYAHVTPWRISLRVGFFARTVHLLECSLQHSRELPIGPFIDGCINPVVLGVGVEMLGLVGVVLAGRIASKVVVVVHLQEIVCSILLLILSKLFLGFFGPNEIIKLLDTACLELLPDLLGSLDLLPPLQRTILGRTHEFPLHLLLTSEVNDQLFLLVGH